MSKIFITGAGGFLGAATAALALARGHETIILARNPDSARIGALKDRCRLVIADLADAEAVRAHLVAERPDIVIHSAWEGVGGTARASDLQLDNIRTTVALVDAAIASGAKRFVGVGSQAEYGRHDRRIDENAATEPFLLYGAAKLSAYHLTRLRCAEARIGFAWLRLFSLYGPGDNPNWLIPSTAAQMLAGMAPKTTAGLQKWDYLHISDAAEGVLAAALCAKADGAFNLCSGRAVAVRAILERLRDSARPDLKLRFGDIPYGPHQIMHLEGDNGRLRRIAGWSPAIDLEQGLAEVVADLKHQNATK